MRAGRNRLRTALAILAAAAGSSSADQRVAANDSAHALQPETIRAAVARAGEAVVEIRTVGGLEKVGRHLVGSGSTTGLIVSEDGYVVSSTLGFLQKPASILIRTPDGQRAAAHLVATDHSRQIVLLKMTVNRRLPLPEPVPEGEFRVGAWAIAVGRTFDGEDTNLSVGIISAVNRIFGKVVQTDAKVSPNNYGGPLVDIHGRVLGVLVPIAPQGDSAVADLEWYDSGIGFAVPLVHVNHILPRLQKGVDLHPGILGLSLARGNPYVLPADVAAVQPNSPASAAGLKPGDRILKTDGRPVETQMQFRYQIAHRYAGDPVHFAVRRDNKTFACSAVLTDRLAPFEHAFIGLLPERSPPAEKRPGVGVRHVYPKSPADRAGIRTGDVVVAVAGRPVATLDEVLAVVNTLSPGDEVAVQVERVGTTTRLQVVTERLPTDLPPVLPRRKRATPMERVRPPAGLTELKMPERQAPCPVYVPRDYDPTRSVGVLIWLPTQDDQAGETPVSRWQPLCDAYDLILLVPSPNDPKGWGRADLDHVRKLLQQVLTTHQVDPTRVVVHGYGVAGTMAYVFALAARDLVRGVAVVDAALPATVRPPANDPVNRLAVYVAKTAGTRFAPAVDSSIEALRAAKYPVTTVDLGTTERRLTPTEMADLARWIDALDRF